MTIEKTYSLQIQDVAEDKCSQEILPKRVSQVGTGEPSLSRQHRSDHP